MWNANLYGTIPYNPAKNDYTGLVQTMSNYDYYTPVSLTKVLLSILPEKRFNSVIDICCGSGNMLMAAYEKYPTTKIVGVDITHTPTNADLKNAEFHLLDGRDYAIQCSKAGKTFDLILSNPPFGYVRDEDKKFNKPNWEDKTYSGLRGNRYEYEMLLANLLMAHEGSYILLVLPSTFVIGRTAQKARCEISIDYSVCSVIELPGNTFGSTQINTFAIILKKEKNRKNPTKLFTVIHDNTWAIKKAGEMPLNMIKAGVWWPQYTNRSAHTAKMCRGTISSNQFKASGSKVLHCAAKKDGPWEPSIRYYDSQLLDRNVVLANQDDVLVNRIGKAAGFWCVNTHDSIPISDCIIVLRNPSPETIATLKASSQADGRLNVPIRGLSTPYISSEDVINLLHEEK